MKPVVVFSCMLVVALQLSGIILGESVHDIICNQEFRGYRLDYRTRTCVRGKVRGCVDPFPYKTRRECMKDFRGRGNLCNSSPCYNGGLCLPIISESRGRTFKCDCTATGYYGKRCQRKCPKNLKRQRRLQTVCIQIG